jgi:hypothetical protein
MWARMSKPTAIALAATMIAVSPCAAQTAAGEWSPTPAMVATIEHRMVLPPGADGPLDTYDRYYTGVKRGGRKLIEVELVDLFKQAGSISSVHIVSESTMPAIGDGGCGVINFDYDVERKALGEPWCNADIRAPPPPPTAP